MAVNFVPARQSLHREGFQVDALKRRNFRPEIQGLRAVAAALVAVYHIFLGRVSGGVDVFFVVSGLLITTTLLSQLEETGAVHPGRYFTRLASRLLPLALSVLTVVMVATLVWLPITRQDATFWEILASSLYVENWELARKSIDYLAADGATSPVQHFWALSIQGQFYLLWFLLFAVLAVLAKRGADRTVLSAAIGLTFVVSLAFSVWLTARDQPAAYFHTGARLWEFAAGGLLALTATRLPQLPKRWAILLGWIGLAMIVSCGALIRVSTAFPGWIALWPVIGALLVLVACDSRLPASQWSCSRLLGSTAFVYVGGISYALYLWHWPILIFYRAHIDDQSVSLVAGMAILAASFVLALIATRLFEGPMRRPMSTLLRPGLAVSVGAIALVASTAFALSRLADRLPAFHTNSNPAIDLIAARKDTPVIYRNGCHQRPGEAEVTTCSFGNLEGTSTVMLVGGSHSAQWFPAVEALANQRGWHLVVAVKSACRFTADAQPDSKNGRACATWNKSLLELILSAPPDLIVTTSTVSGRKGEVIPPGYLRNWRALEQANIPVVAIRDNPRWSFDPLECLSKLEKGAQECAVARSDTLSEVDPTSQLQDPPSNVKFIDLNEFICDGDSCPANSGEHVTFRDRSHLTATHTRKLAKPLAEKMGLHPSSTRDLGY
jgi:peptidoglycan/LPS O-acetylase OafA/YrhL